MAASSGVDMFDHFETINTLFRSVAPLPEPRCFQNLSPDERSLLREAKNRVVKFIVMMLASPDTQVARTERGKRSQCP
jgi:hypothetical protein